MYVFVIDISEDLDTPVTASCDHLIHFETRKNDMTTLNILHFWLAAIYSKVGEPQNSQHLSDDLMKVEKTACSPKVLIIGTHRNSVHVEPITRDQIISEAIEKIHKSLEGKPYLALVDKHILAVDCNQMSCDEPTLLEEVRLLIDKNVEDENPTGFEIPLSWLNFEQIHKKLLQRQIYFCDFNQLHEVTASQFEVFSSFQTFRSMLHFYHSQGRILLLGRCQINEVHSSDESVILDPHWFMKCLFRLCDAVRIVDGDDNFECRQGMLREEIVNRVWNEVIDHKMLLLGCLEKLDLVCELRPYFGVDHDPPDITASAIQPKLYFFPWITQLLPEAYGVQSEPVSGSLRLAIDFKDLLPIGLFSRLVVRLGKWSWAQGWGRRPEVCHGEARIGVDFDHDLVLRIKLQASRIDVIIIKIYESMQNDDCSSTGPTPNICVKVSAPFDTSS